MRQPRSVSVDKPAAGHGRWWNLSRQAVARILCGLVAGFIVGFIVLAIQNDSDERRNDEMVEISPNESGRALVAANRRVPERIFRSWIFGGSTREMVLCLARRSEHRNLTGEAFRDLISRRCRSSKPTWLQSAVL
jgi:hypothetical protein